MTRSTFRNTIIELLMLIAETVGITIDVGITIESSNRLSHLKVRNLMIVR